MSHSGCFQIDSSDEEATVVHAPAAVGQETRSSRRMDKSEEEEDASAAAQHPRRGRPRSRRGGSTRRRRRSSGEDEPPSPRRVRRRRSRSPRPPSFRPSSSRRRPSVSSSVDADEPENMSHSGRFQIDSSDEEATVVAAVQQPQRRGRPRRRGGPRRRRRGSSEEHQEESSSRRDHSPSLGSSRPPSRRRRSSVTSSLDDLPGPSSRPSRRRRSPSISVADDEPGPSWRLPTGRASTSIAVVESDSDEDYTPEKSRAKSKKDYKKRIRHPNLNLGRPRKVQPISEPDFDPETIHQTAFLGPMNNECDYCGALHFDGHYTCCRRGKVFIPPFPKMPEPVEMLLYDVNNAKRNKFRKNIIRYNVLFSFASVQYDHAPVNKYGVQIAKARGVVRHFPSALLSGRPDVYNFGNFYLFEGQEAVDLRMQHPFLAHDLDEEIIRDLTEVFDRNPFASFYHTMREIMDEQDAQGLNPFGMAMRIVSPFEKEKIDALQGHPGIYGRRHEGDFISVYFSSTVDQRQLPKGLNIYARTPYHNFVPKPLFPWLNVVDPLCYVIMRPRGETGWSPKSFHYVEPKLFEERLAEYDVECRESGRGGRETWDWEQGAHHRTRQTATRESDPNLEVISSSEDDSDPDEFPDFQRGLDNGESEGFVRFVEHDGDFYPERDYDDDQEFPVAEEDDPESGPEDHAFQDPPGIPSNTVPDQENIDLTDIHVGNLANDEENMDYENEMDVEPTAGPSAREDIYSDIGGTEGAGDAQEDTNWEQNLHDDDEEDELLPEEEVEVDLSDDLDDLHYYRRRTHRVYVSQRDYANYLMQNRTRFFKDRVAACGKLGQLFLIDMFTRIQRSEYEMKQQHNIEHLKSDRKRFLRAFQRVADRRNRKIGVVCTMPASIRGSPRYMHMKFEETITMARELGPPDLFITMTASTEWKEIVENIPPGHTWADHPAIMNEVFHKKMEMMLDDVLGKKRDKTHGSSRNPGIFGEVAWYAYSIEFQERGPPHIHLIVSLVNHISTIQQIDSVCKGVIPVLPPEDHPDYNKQLKLRELVVKYMVHTPCEGVPEAYCNEGRKPNWKQCRKHFPKPFKDVTELGDKTYPDLKRPDNGESVEKRRADGETVLATNQYVVSYNPFLLAKYQCHLNVEVISTLKVLKYIFKYLYKGFDRALVETIEKVGKGEEAEGIGEMTFNGYIIHPKTIKIPPGVLEQRNEEARKLLSRHRIRPKDENGNPLLVYNEYNIIEDMRAVTPNEAAWEIAGYKRSGLSHKVTFLSVHKPDEEPIIYEPDTEADVAQRLEREEVKSQLKAWFELNRKHETAALNKTFDQIPKYFSYKNGRFVKHKRNVKERNIGRIWNVRPTNLELFAIKMLCENSVNIKSFEELRTVQGTVYNTFAEAAQVRGLMNSQREWDYALTEAALTENPKTLRRLFISILLFCAPSSPSELWENHKKDFYHCIQWTDEMNEAHALQHIKKGLAAHGKLLENFNLPEVDLQHLPAPPFQDIDSEFGGPTDENHKKLADDIYKMLNEEQKEVAHEILKSINQGPKKCFFIEAPGGCGKTTIYKYLYHELSAAGKTVMCVAHTGLAASILPHGQTAHRAFGIPLTVAENMHSDVHYGSDKAIELSKVHVFLFDEAVMTDRRIMTAIDELLRNIHPQNGGKIFGGIPMIMGGDWRQTLPIVEGQSTYATADYTLKKSTLWDDIKTLHLTRNMRAAGDPEYAQWIKDVGEGKTGDTVELDPHLLTDTESKAIFDLFARGRIMKPDVQEGSCILTIDNKASLELNDQIIQLVPGEQNARKGLDNGESEGFVRFVEHDGDFYPERDYDDNQEFPVAEEDDPESGPEDHAFQDPPGIPSNIVPDQENMDLTDIHVGNLANDEENMDYENERDVEPTAGPSTREDIYSDIGGTEGAGDAQEDTNWEQNLHDNDEEDELLPEEEVELDLSDDLDDLHYYRRTTHRVYVSQRDYANYLMQKRTRFFKDRVAACGKLGQLFLIDMFTRIQRSEYEMKQQHNIEHLKSDRKRFLRAFQRVADRRNRKIGVVCTMPASIRGSPRYMHMKFEETVTMARELGPPDLFITMTASTEWKEILENIPPGHTWADHPAIMNEVFHKKMEMMLDDVLGKKRDKTHCSSRNPGIFGKVAWHAFSIEFQERGPPHVHLIVSLANHISTIQQIDSICKGVIPVLPPEDHPDYNKQLKLRELVVKYMVHTPCEGVPEAYCNEGRKPNWKQCRKHFPKPFKDVTELGDKTYPDLKRPDNGESVEKRRADGETVLATNQYVVSYNPFLLAKYQCHLNVEVISTLKVLKYIFKYLYKGFDRALVETIEKVGKGEEAEGIGEMTFNGYIIHPKTIKIPPGVLEQRNEEARKLLSRHRIRPKDENGNPLLVYNEYNIIEDMRAVTPNEAAWEIAGYKRSGLSHKVTFLSVHKPDEEPIIYEPDTEADVAQRLEREEVKSQLKAWFELNRKHETAALNKTFDQIPKYFSYKNGKFVKHKRNVKERNIGRIWNVRPTNLELFAIKMLCENSVNIKSFEELRTVQGTVYNTFAEAAQVRGLMNSQREWDYALTEAALTENPKTLRRLFISILLFCAPSSPSELWENHKKDFYHCIQWTDEMNEAHALQHIKKGLAAHGKLLENFNLPEVDLQHLPAPPFQDIDSEFGGPTDENHKKMADDIYKILNEEQKEVAHEILKSINQGPKKCFFIEAPGGCGKTTIYKYLYHELSAAGKTVMCVAHTGLAASILPHGQTAHRAFGIPLTVAENMHSDVHYGSDKAIELSKVHVFLFDEAVMTDRRIMTAIDELLRNIHPQNGGKIFGGIPMIMGGDWRQTLPIVEGQSTYATADYTLKKSTLWNEIKTLHLTRNMRAAGDPEYAKWIKDVGEGKTGDTVELDQHLLTDTESEAIFDLFARGRIMKPDVQEGSCILTIDNKASLELNDQIIQLVPGEQKIFESRDEFDRTRGFPDTDPRIYNMTTPNGLPPHKLKLKVGCVVILLKNLNTYLGYCNGTRLRVIGLGDNIVKCVPVNKTKTQNPLILHRMALCPAETNCQELAFVRWQIPVRLAYAMTVNKSQGQTLTKVALILRTSVFSHGQLYVALSRVRASTDIKIVNESNEDKTKVRNIVVKAVLEA